MSFARRTVLLACAVSALAAGPARAETAGPVLSCAGPLAADGSHDKVVAAFGDKNVVFTEVDGAEGEKIAATVIFPNDPGRRIELFWADEAKRARLASARPDRANRAAAPNGIRPGMSLAEVEKLNGRPFELSGFDWDYGGAVTDWKGGALGRPAPGGCIVSVQFALPPKVSETAAAAVAGDRAFASADAKIRAAAPIVDAIALGWPQQ
jgi:hypothetical protein